MTRIVQLAFGCLAHAQHSYAKHSHAQHVLLRAALVSTALPIIALFTIALFTIALFTIAPKAIAKDICESPPAQVASLQLLEPCLKNQRVVATTLDRKVRRGRFAVLSTDPLANESFTLKTGFWGSKRQTLKLADIDRIRFRTKPSARGKALARIAGFAIGGSILAFGIVSEGQLGAFYALVPALGSGLTVALRLPEGKSVEVKIRPPTPLSAQ
jgi:hypothetical protein